jgi:hypothetical protein
VEKAAVIPKQGPCIVLMEEKGLEADIRTGWQRNWSVAYRQATSE